MEWETVLLEDPGKSKENNALDNKKHPDELEEGDMTYGVFQRNGSKYLVYVMKLPQDTPVEESIVNTGFEIFDE